MKDNGKKWKTALYEKRELSRQGRVLQVAQKHAARYLRHLQEKEFPGKSLIQLLLVVARDGPLLAGAMAVEHVELNQKNLSADDREFLQQVKVLLAKRAEQTGCPVS